MISNSFPGKQSTKVFKLNVMFWEDYSIILFCIIKEQNT